MKRAPMPDHPRRLEESYRARAVPAGSPRYFSWLFAAPPMRDPLLGIYALLAEWRSLVDPGVELTAGHLKLAWWREEIDRLNRGAPVHPISRYIGSLPRAGEVDFTPLEKTLEALARQIDGAPLERGAELEAHAAALWAEPLATAARLAGERFARRVRPAPALAEAVHRAEAALAAAEYLNDAIAGYRRAAHFGRVAFPVDELLAANVEDSDLGAAEPPLHLQSLSGGAAPSRGPILLAGKRGRCRVPSASRCGTCSCSRRSARARRMAGGTTACCLCASCISPGARRAALYAGNERSIDGIIGETNGERITGKA